MKIKFKVTHKSETVIRMRAIRPTDQEATRSRGKVNNCFAPPVTIQLTQEEAASVSVGDIYIATFEKK